MCQEHIHVLQQFASVVVQTVESPRPHQIFHLPPVADLARNTFEKIQQTGKLAIGMAQTLQIDPRPFLVAIAVAASASFATPIGYQTNTYVYGVGGYRFADFAKIGIPLNILAFIISMLVIPMVWTFN